MYFQQGRQKSLNVTSEESECYARVVRMLRPKSQNVYQKSQNVASFHLVIQIQKSYM